MTSKSTLASTADARHGNGPASSSGADQRDLAKRSLAALAWNYAGAVGRMLAQLVIQVLLARLLGPQAFGQAMAAMVVLGFGFLLADAGFGAALVQRKEVSEHDIGYALGWVLLMSGVMAAAIGLAAGPVAGLFGDAGLAPLIVGCAALIPLQALVNLPTSLMRRALQMKRLQIIQLGSYVFAYGSVGLALAWLGFGAWSLVLAFAAHTLVSLVCTYASVRHTLRPRLKGDPALRNFGLRVMATNIANWSIDNLDRMVVSRQWGAAALGAYSVASNLSRAPASLLVTSIQSVVFASASKVQAEPAKLARGFLAVVGLVALLVFPVAGFLALHAELIVHTLYGDRWTQAAPLFAAFCVGLPFFAVLSIVGPLLWAVNAVGSELRVQIFTGVCIVGGLWLLARWPLAWAVWIVPACYAARVSLMYRALASRVGVAPARTLRALAGGSVCVVVTVLVHVGVGSVLAESLPSAALGAVLTALACLLSLRLSRGRLVPPELAATLLDRAAGSKAARGLCGLLALGGGAGR